MRIIEGTFAGSNGRIVRSVLKGPVFEIKTGIMQSKTYAIPKDIETFKLISKDEQRTLGQLIIILLLAITIIGLLLAIPLFILWKRITFTVGVKTRDGSKFIASGDASDWKIAKQYIGLGAIESF